MVFVALIKELYAVKIGRFPLGIVSEVIPVEIAGSTVTFQIGFIHQIKAVFVAKAGETRVVWIVAGADGVDIVAF